MFSVTEDLLKRKMQVCFDLAGKPPPILPDAAGSRAR